MATDRPLIHIGLPKTGTTTLQSWFSRISEMRYLGKQFQSSLDPEQQFIHIVTDRKTLEYKAQREDFAEWAKEIIGIHSVDVLSEESLSTGSSLLGKVSRSEIAHRLADLFPNAHILMVIRNQYDVLASAFTQELKMGAFQGSFHEWLSQHHSQDHLTTLFDYFQFDDIYSLYASLFGTENITVLAFEQMINHASEFQLILESLLGTGHQEPINEIWANQRPSQLHLRFLLRLRRSPALRSFVRRSPATLKQAFRKVVDIGPSVDVRYSPDWATHIEDRFGKGNQYMQRITGFPLEKWEYPMD